jgi:hypothetical protein
MDKRRRSREEARFPSCPGTYVGFWANETGVAMDLDEEGAAFLGALAQALELPALQFGNDDSSAFALDGKLVFQLNLDRVAEEVVIGVIFGVLPTDYGDADFLRELLGANYYWRLTQGGTIGFDETSGALALAFRVPLPMRSPAQIEDMISRFAGAADHWRQHVVAAGVSTQQPDSAMIRV